MTALCTPAPTPKPRCPASLDTVADLLGEYGQWEELNPACRAECALYAADLYLASEELRELIEDLAARVKATLPPRGLERAEGERLIDRAKDALRELL